jgi:protein-disulfide isomerase
MLLGGCGGGAGVAPTSAVAATHSVPPPLPGPAGGPKLAATGEPRMALTGVDTSNLSDRERALFGRLIAELYAPCAEQAVSVAQCVEEARPCAACAPAARFLADRAHRGANAEEARIAYATRFGPDVKEVALGDSPSRGPEDAKVTIVVWSDFECPHCRMVMPILDRIVSANAPRVRLVHKFYPLRMHKSAEPAARAAIAAKNQGRYWEMEQTLFKNQQRLSDADLEQYAGSLKLDMRRFHGDLQAPATTDTIARDRAEADRLGLTGTPFIFIDGRPFDLDYFHVSEDLEPWIALELELRGGVSAAH